MSDALTLGVAARSLRRLTAGGARTRARIERLAQLAEAEPDERMLSLGEVVEALYPGDAGGLDRFRELRSALRSLAQVQDVALVCEVDGHKHAPAVQRRCWFEGVDDDVERIEQLSVDASQAPPGTVTIDARARPLLRVCIDAAWAPSAIELACELTKRLQLDTRVAAIVTDTQVLAGERPEELRASRLSGADVVVVLLDHDYLVAHRDSVTAKGRVVVPVALQRLAAGVDLGAFGQLLLAGDPYGGRRQQRGQFANALHEAIVARVTRPVEYVAHWQQPWPQDMPCDVVSARAVRTSVERPDAFAEDRAQRVAVDDSVDVQEYLQRWADDLDGQPYLVIFGEYGMGKTTACQVFTRALHERRQQAQARLPIYFDLRNLGDVKLTEPSLEQLLEDLLTHAWHSDQAGRPKVAEVIEQVQRRGALVVFDGLDEVLVHLSERQGRLLLRQLWSILPPRLHGDRAAGRVLTTCRTHFFRTLREQRAYFRGEDREPVGAESYAALHLLPFSESQVRAYLQRRAVDGGVDRALAVIRAVHNLSELVTRPYTLRLVAGQLAALERRIASGERVDAAALYDELVANWLDRDDGKHQLRKDDKLRLMEELAAELWRSGRRSLPVDALEDWLHRRLDGDDELGRWFRVKRLRGIDGSADVTVLAEDLRTATFVVRPHTSEFQFAHTSLLEYFLARRLRRALVDRDAQTWALPRTSDETLDFLGELVAAGDTPACLRGLRDLRSCYRAQASELAFAYCLRAPAGAAPAIAGFVLDGARLRGVRVIGRPDRPRLSLKGCRLAGADLRDARLELARLEDCDLRGADLTRAELHDCVLQRVSLDGAVLAGTIARDCRAPGLDLRTAHAHRAQWLRCELSGVRWPTRAGTHLVAPARRGAAPASSAAPPASVFAGHSGMVNAVAFAPDGARLASASGDATVRVWDAVSGDELLTLSGHSSMVNAVAFAPDGARLASASDDATVRVWDAVRMQEALAIHAFTAGEHAVFRAGVLSSCSPGAWRWLGVLVASASGRTLTRLPVETFEPLPARTAAPTPPALN